MIFWKNTTFCIDINLVLGKGTRQSKPLLRSLTPLNRQWIKSWLPVVFSQTFLRHSIRWTTRISYLNSTIMAYVEYPLTGVKTIFTIALTLLRLVLSNLTLFSLFLVQKCKSETVCPANSWEAIRGEARQVHQKHKLPIEDKKTLN